MVKNDNIPLVSIICITYNHENFIRQAIDGFLIQNTSFQIEIIIHDDASTDNTQAIVKEYELKYPGLFNNIYQTENQYSKNDLHLWGDITFPLAKGKYIAMCEGDDYWTDPNKLQRQIDFLENAPNFTGTFHNVLMYNENTKNEKYLLENTSGDKSYFFKELIYLNPIHTSSFVFRNNLVNSEIKYFKLVSDRPLFTLLCNLGPIEYIDFVGSCYRINQNSIWSPLSISKQILLVIESFKIVIKFMHPENKRPVKIKISGYYFNLGVDKSLSFQDRFKYLFMAFKFSLRFNYLFYALIIIKSSLKDRFSIEN